MKGQGYRKRMHAPEGRLVEGTGHREPRRRDGDRSSAQEPNARATQSRVAVWGCTHAFRPVPSLQSSRTREARVRLRSDAGARRCRGKHPVPPAASGAWGSSPDPEVTRCAARAGHLPSPAPFPTPQPPSAGDLGSARPCSHRPKRGAGQRRGVCSAPSPPLPSPTRGSADAHGRALTWPPPRAGLDGRGREAPPLPRPRPLRANGRDRPDPSGVTRWGRDLRGLRKEPAGGRAARGGRAEAAGPGTPTQRAGGRRRAGQAPQPVAVAASPLRSRERGGGRAACEGGRSGGRGAAPSVLSGDRGRRGPAPR